MCLIVSKLSGCLLIVPGLEMTLSVVLLFCFGEWEGVVYMQTLRCSDAQVSKRVKRRFSEWLSESGWRAMMSIKCSSFQCRTLRYAGKLPVDLVT
ncbi:hypothetical protein A2U01_0014166 [Trifolium medium]|uniref:Uncharacterized protein n=1 Tax=Trifolium medium TaxID=97028 RepID=A0A392N2M2_9FABA|nr:hypothetical protein [Trifolium medium]